MDMNADSMVSAVQEVTSVAEELRALRDRVRQYGDASKRLAEVAEILKDLNGSVVRMKDSFAGALDQARQAQEMAADGRRAVDGLVASVPEVVKRIEASDVGKSIELFSARMKQLSELLDSHQRSVVQLSSDFSEERETQSAGLIELVERIDRLQAGITSLCGETTGVNETVSQQARLLQGLTSAVSTDVIPQLKRCAEILIDLKGIVSSVGMDGRKTSDAIADISEKVFKEFAAIRADVVGTRQLVEAQGKIIVQQAQMLEQMSKKKRGFFG